MEELIWIFPILFVFHDMEEIIGAGNLKLAHAVMNAFTRRLKASKEAE